MNLLEGTESAVRVNGRLTPSFKITTGVPQGDVMSPKLFIVGINHVLEAVEERGVGGAMFKQRKLYDLAYADDLAMFCDPIDQLQMMLEGLQEAADRVGLVINQTKTKIMHVARNQPPALPTVTLRGVDLEWVKDFVYLGSKVADSGGATAEINRRTGIMAGAFEKFRKIFNPL